MPSIDEPESHSLRTGNTFALPNGQAMTDFLDAHNRHWDDAELLMNQARLPNADHLYGVSAECGLKRLMERFGMPVDNGMPKIHSDRKHIDEIWPRYEAYRSGHADGAACSLPLANPFDDWSASQRYFVRNFFDQQRVDAHQGGANAVLQLVRNAQLIGLLP